MKQREEHDGNYMRLTLVDKCCELTLAHTVIMRDIIHIEQEMNFVVDTTTTNYSQPSHKLIHINTLMMFGIKLCEQTLYERGMTIKLETQGDKLSEHRNKLTSKKTIQRKEL